MASLISVGQVLDHSLEHCRKHYKELVAITLWMVIASIPTIIGKILAPSGEDPGLSGGDWLSFSFSLIGVIVVTIVSLWMYATLTYAVAEQAAGKSTNLKTVYRKGWQSFFQYLLLTLLIAGIVICIFLLSAPGYALLFFGTSSNAPAIIVTLGTPIFLISALVTLVFLIKYTVQLAFAPYILLLEKKSPVEAIQNSISLVKGRWWATCIRFAIPKAIYFLVLFVITFVVSTALEMLLALVMTSSPVGALAVYTLSLFVSVFLSAIVTPLIIATDYYLYDSLRKTR